MSDGQTVSGIADTLGHEFQIARITVKIQVGCGHDFPAIDGTLALQNKHGVDPKNIRHIHIETYQPSLAIACHDDPKTANEARFSLEYMVATALVHGDVRLNAFSPERIACPTTRALMGRITAAVSQSGRAHV